MIFIETERHDTVTHQAMILRLLKAAILSAYRRALIWPCPDISLPTLTRSIQDFPLYKRLVLT